MSDADELGQLRTEVTNLRRQVQELFRTEAKLSRAEIDLKHQLRIFGDLHRVGIGAMQARDPRRIGRQAATFATDSVRYARAIVLVADEETSELVVRGLSGVDGDTFSRLAKTTLPITDLAPNGAVDRLLAAGKAVRSTSPELSDLLGALELEEAIAFPLADDERRVFGAIIAGSAADEVGNALAIDDAPAAAALANLASQTAAALVVATTTNALEEHRRLLEQRVIARTNDLQVALARLERADAAKNHLFAHISHELRTPLTLSIGPIEEVLGRPEMADGQRQHLLRVVRANQLRLVRLINNLLDLTRFEAAAITSRFRRTDLAQATAHYLEPIAAAASSRNLTVRLERPEGPVEVWADREKLEKIVLNLLSNAFKFTPDGGSITARVFTDGDFAKIAIADSGIGISEADQARLFQPFERVESSERQAHAGTGLGLAMVKELTTAHGGSVELTSTPGAGTTFTVGFRRDREQMPTGAFIEDERPFDPVTAQELADFGTVLVDGEYPPEQSDAPAEDGRPLVLVVDDVRAMRELVKRSLGRHFRVMTAGDGAAALAAARVSLPDLIVSDVVMPTMDGIELCASLKREKGPLALVPIILLSARSELADTITGLERGANDYVAKPFSADELLLRAKNLVHLRDQERAVAESRVRAAEADLARLRSDSVLASEMRKRLLPARNERETASGIAIAGALRPGEHACDLWGYRVLREDKVLLWVAESLLPGARGVFVLARAMGVIDGMLARGASDAPGDILRELETMLLASGEAIAIAACLLDDTTGRVVLANAGLPHPLVVEVAATRAIVEPSAPLGTGTTPAFVETTFDLPRGCGLVLYSSSIVDTTREGRPFGMRRLREALAGDELDVATLESALSVVEQFGDTELSSDLVIASLRR